MNEEKKTLQSEVESLVKKEIPSLNEHPLQMLHNQTDPDNRPKVVLQKPIRTYESDIAEAIANKKTSVLNIAIEEKKRTDGTQSATISNSSTTKTSSSGSLKKFFMLLLSIILIAGGIGGGYYLYLQSPLALSTPDTQPNNIIPGIIKADNQQIVELGTIKTLDFPLKIRDILFNGKSDLNKINEYILSNTSGSTTSRIDSTQFFQMLDTSVPESFNRSLTKKWMLGTFDEESKKVPFIILTTDFFQNTFAGMLKWENSMTDEMAIAFNYEDRARQESSTSTLSSFFTIRGKFNDRTILNRDVREFISENGEILILYSFIDKDTLVITTDENVLSKIINRIEKQSYLR
jgi:hypothetical protein